jgi:hypothetical protein
MCALMVFACLALVGRAMASVVVSDSFAGGLGGWMHGSDAEGVAGFRSGATAATTPAHADHSSAVLNAEGDGPGGVVWLDSAFPIDPGIYKVTVSFWVYSSNDADGTTSKAIAAIKGGSIGGGSDFSFVRRIEPSLGWQHLRMTKTVSVERGQKLHVGMGFQRTSMAAVKYAFDDVAVDLERVDCRADVDGSGSLSVQDVFSFMDAWFDGAPAGDFDGSGRIDMHDVFAFLNAWLAGCGAGA